MLKFYYNGIKTSDCPKLQLCSYSADRLLNHAEGTITIYGKHYRHFSPEVAAAFKVVNGTDIQSDYFENDRIRVEPSHPLYPHVLKAWGASQEHNAKRWAKQLARCDAAAESARAAAWV